MQLASPGAASLIFQSSDMTEHQPKNLTDQPGISLVLKISNTQELQLTTIIFFDAVVNLLKWNMCTQFNLSSNFQQLYYCIVQTSATQL